MEVGEKVEQHLAAFLDSGYADLARPHTSEPDTYTYWDYYRQRFERNRGMRIDFVLGNPSLATTRLLAPAAKLIASPCGDSGSATRTGLPPSAPTTSEPLSGHT